MSKFWKRGIPTIGIVVIASLVVGQTLTVKYNKTDSQRVTKAEMKRHIESMQKTGVEDTVSYMSKDKPKGDEYQMVPVSTKSSRDLNRQILEQQKIKSQDKWLGKKFFLELSPNESIKLKKFWWKDGN